jgi:hypothetical protein
VLVLVPVPVLASLGLRGPRLRVMLPAPSSLRATDIRISSQKLRNVKNASQEAAFAGIRR